ncbi:unnamed protein product [Clonostachys rosea]|uniref:ATP-dependent RNA helicase n=1 Tax=Bionectria ochroleuca TaxID=29856 RepID=A0ABY6U7Y7_BIOOC|nr:unnamed protein product [Clonostachys rosea]
MFRQALRNCVRPAGSLVSLARAPTGLSAVTRQNLRPVYRSVTPLKSIANTYRAYSDEAAALQEERAHPAPAHDVVNFKDLTQVGVHGSLIDAIVRDMGYESMTPVQSKTINPALKGTDIVAQAKTGTGKTIAFLLPMLNRMITEDRSLASRGASQRARSDDIRGIVLSPTRELAEQIAVEARRLTRNTGLVVQSAVGGTNKTQMLRNTQRQGCHLLVATPGRLNDLLQDPRSGIDAPNLAALVLDEADRMLDVGFEQELNQIIQLLPDPSTKVRQTMLVSATIPDDVIRLARTMVRADDFEFVQTIPENESLTHDKVPQHVVPVSSWANVFPTLFELIDREAAKAAENPDSPPFKAIVYFNTTSMVELAGEVAFSRKREGLSNVSSFSIQSKLTQVQRSRAAEMFRNARSAILLSSDVTARGMDFPNVTHVIQVDAPRSREDYIHRLGRTGRQGKEGEGWLLLPPQGVQSARRMLAGLPIKQNASLDSAEADIEAGALPPIHQQFQDLTQRVPRSILGSAYTSLFGASASKEELARDLYHWATRGWGWPKPPGVSARWAHQMNISASHLNIQDGGRNWGDRGDRGNRGDRRGGQEAEPVDAFEAMGRQARSDKAPTWRGSSGGRGYGRAGSYGRSEGYGRDRNSRSSSW